MSTAQSRQAQPAAETSLLKNLTIFALLTGVYFLSGKLGLKLATVNPSATPVWPPTGVALAALVIFGSRVWPAIFVGAFLVNLTTAGTVATSIVIAAGNTLEGLVGATLVSVAARGRNAFNRTEDVFKFAFLAGILSTLVSATIGVTCVSLGGFAQWSDFGHIFLTWWLGDATGAFVVAPVIILWSNASTVRWNRFRVLEVATLFVSLSIVGMWIFANTGPAALNTYPIKFLTFPFLLWAAIRFGQREAATAVLVLSAIAVWGDLSGSGPFASTSRNEALLLLQLFMAVMSAATLSVGASIAERKRAEAALQDTLDKLIYKVEERTRAFEESEESLNILSARMLSLQDDERRRIARELHDSTGQKLAALSMNLALAEKEVHALSPAAQRALAECFTLIDESVREMRTLSYLLHPPFLDELGLGAALRWYAEGFSKRSGVHIELDASVETKTAPKVVEMTLFRIVQECLTNIHRHAKSSSVKIRLHADATELKLEVENRGHDVPLGVYDSESPQSFGVGIRGMRERVRQLNGKLEIHSSEQGATVRVSLPLQNTPSELDSSGDAGGTS